MIVLHHPSLLHLEETNFKGFGAGQVWIAIFFLLFYFFLFFSLSFTLSPSSYWSL